MSSFTPDSQNNNSSASFEPRNYPVPKRGSRKARVSLIVDLGVQGREPIYELNGKVVNQDTPNAVCKPQKDCQQIAVFADLVADTVDYGGAIGKQHYRLPLNNSFKGVFKGINFTAVPPKNADGELIAGKKWGFAPASVLSKLAKAVGKPEVIESMDVSQLLGCAFMASVEVKENDSGKVDKEGEPIIYKNVNYKGCAELPTDDDTDLPVNVAELNCKPLCITFKNAKAEHIKFVRPSLVKQIKLASNYAGSQMQKAIEQYEASLNDESDEAEAAPVAKKQEASKPVAKVKPVVTQPDPDEDDSSPF
jgi:hypothetical protein